MVELFTPGVYVQEIPSGIRSIAAVSTSNTAFIGYFSQGPVDEARRINNYGDFVRIFGGLDSNSITSYAIEQFYLNGGSTGYVVRVVEDSAEVASIQLNDDGPAKVFDLVAANEGTWGNRLQYQIEHDATPNNFTLTVQLVSDLAATKPTILASETHRNLTTRTIATLLEADSDLVRAADAADTDNRPVETNGFEDLVSVSLILQQGSNNLFRVSARDNSAAGENISVAVAHDSGTFTLDVTQEDGGGTTIATETYEGLTNATAATVVNRNSRLVRLTNLDTSNTNLPTVIGATALSFPASSARGTNGALPGSTNWGSAAADLIRGDESDKSGIYALLDIEPEIFNIMCIPDAAELDDLPAAQSIYAAATDFCIDKRAFLIVDVPDTEDTVEDARDWADNFRSDYAAMYYPRVQVLDPFDNGRLRNIPNSGTLAGLYARTDNSRGVWQSPAGTDRPLRGVTLADRLTDAENAQLNPFGVNALRNLPIYGNVSWGARTLFGENARAHEYNYIAVRRTALFIEESLVQGLQWVVFEGNDEKLWSQIRVNVTAFMQTLFRKGAFAGTSPRDAYLVKCDSETTTPTDVNLGIVNILVGFAPLKPAEFVVISLQQLAQPTS